MAKNELEKFLIAQEPDDLLMAAENGNPEAMYHVGYMYYNGIHENKDYAKANTWLQRAAMCRNADAAYFLGLMYLKGEGADKNTMRGFGLIENAASQHHKEAQALIRRIEKRYTRAALNDIDIIDHNVLEPPKPLIDPIYKNYALWLYVAGFLFLILLPLPGVFMYRLITGYLAFGILLLVYKKLGTMY